MIKIKEIINQLKTLTEKLNDDCEVCFRPWDQKFEISVNVYFQMPTGDGGTYWESETDVELLTRREALDYIKGDS